jgi:hypothetical protein
MDIDIITGIVQQINKDFQLSEIMMRHDQICVPLMMIHAFSSFSSCRVRHIFDKKSRNPSSGH